MVQTYERNEKQLTAKQLYEIQQAELRHERALKRKRREERIARAKRAERIVFNDTLGMETSDVMIFDYLPHAQGTICEMGYAQHLKRASEKDIKIYVQCTDIRQGTGHISNEQDRAEFSINQYVYGVIMDVTDGRGIQTFDEICKELVGE